jgi:DNA-binding MarR family transcriptional regulator
MRAGEANIDMSIKEMSTPLNAMVRAAKPAAGSGPPPRAEKIPAPVAGTDAEVNRYLAAYIMGVANRLANGASNHYRTRFGIGMSEWRAMMAIGSSSHRIVREVAEMADLDYAAASKSLKLLETRGLVAIEQTQRRGRAAIASLTPEGLAVYRKLRDSARRRQNRLLATFTPEEVETLWSLLRRVEQQVPHMNAES